MLICHYSLLFFMMMMMKSSTSTISTKTYPTVHLRENVRINTTVISLLTNEERSVEMKRLKLTLLDLNGFETNLFEIRNGNVCTTNEIDREQFVGEKRCFDRLYCLIELHILVNDGQQYWVISIHIVDENDNKPQFKSSSIAMKYSLNNEVNEYKIPFEGAIDLDEGINSRISYLLDCSMEKRKDWIMMKTKNERTLNCLPLFDLIIFSQSLINQYDQLGLKFNPSSSSFLRNDYELVLYAFNVNQHGEKELINSMVINIQVEKFLEKPRFVMSEYRIMIKDSFSLRRGKRIGQVHARSNDAREKMVYQLINETNEVEINSMTGELYFSTDHFNRNEMQLMVEASYLSNSQIKSFVPILIIVRLLKKLNENRLINYQIKSSSIDQMNNSNEFHLHKSIWMRNEILFSLSLICVDYPSDLFHLSLLNSYSFFRLLSPLETHNNDYLLEVQPYSFQSNVEYFLSIQVKHYLTNEYLSNLTIKLVFDSTDDTSNRMESSSLRTTICLENTTFDLYDVNRRELVSKMKVMETNVNVFSFGSFVIWKENPNEMMVDECPMRMMENDSFNQSAYRLCSSSLNQCFNISLYQQRSEKKMMLFKRLLEIRPIEMIILSVSCIFILVTMTVILIICRLRGFHLCLSMKNYLFYGKKYGLNRAQRLSSTKITERVHSIVVRESRSPSIDHIKSLEPYIFSINQYVEQERMPSIDLHGESSPSQMLPTSESRRSSLERGERSITNADQEIKCHISGSSSLLAVVQETNQLLGMTGSNEDVDFYQLASEV